MQLGRQVSGNLRGPGLVMESGRVKDADSLRRKEGAALSPVGDLKQQVVNRLVSGDIVPNIGDEGRIVCIEFLDASSI